MLQKLGLFSLRRAITALSPWVASRILRGLKFDSTTAVFASLFVSVLCLGISTFVDGCSPTQQIHAAGWPLAVAHAA